MRLARLTWLKGAVLIAALALAACDSPEEQAESHYQSAIALLAKGEPDRAAIELRNALQANAAHLGARYEYAGLLRAQKDVPGAIGQYLRLVELDPENGMAHLALAELALQVRDVPGVEQHTERAYALMPDNPDARALKASVSFRRGDIAGALEMAEGVLAERPDNAAAHLILIADRLAASDYSGALARADAAIALAPDNEDLLLARLAALDQEGDTEAVGQQLERMVELFPDNSGLRQALLQWHLRQGDKPAALAVLRETAEHDPDATETRLNIAQFRLETEGPAAAREELESLIASAADPRPYRRALAQLDFAEGRRDEAIAAVEKLVEGQESSPEIRDLQIALAQMLEATGRQDESVAVVEAVLAADPRNVNALKMRARRYILADKTELALADLQTAITDAPRDAEIMTIMAMAYEREGATEQVGERLARAVEASNSGIPESLRYSRFLIKEGRLGPAESVVLDALRRAPENQDLLVTLGQVHLQRSDWTRARQVAGLLRDLGDPAAAEQAAGLEIAALQGEGRAGEVIDMLQGLIANEGEGNLRARVGLVQARLAEGDVEGAEAEVAAMLAEDPQSLPGRMMQAALLVLKGQPADAEVIYRAVIAEQPTFREPYQILFALQNGQGRGDEARATLDEGIAATNRDGNLLNTKAGLLYVEGDFDGAIAIYEELYARDTTNVVTANNLASVLSTYREDPESLERAYQVARRLRGTEIPHFQDTYGWILVQRGENEEALTYLEPAAGTLTTDPQVQYHLGMAYFGLQRWDDARTALARAVEVAGADSTLPQIAAAQTRIAEIDAGPPAAAPNQ